MDRFLSIFLLRVHKITVIRLSNGTCLEHPNENYLTALRMSACVSSSKISFLVDRLLSIQRARVDPERAAEAVEAVRRRRMIFRAAAET